jgi:hypothetical protein
MKISRVVIFAAALLVFTGVASADTVDPAIGVKGGGGSLPWAGSVTVLFEPGQDGVSCSGGLCSYDTTTGEVGAYFITGGSITDFAYSFSQSQNTGFSKTGDNVFPDLTIVNDVNTANPLAFLSGGTILPADSCIEGCGANTISGDFALEAFDVVQGTVGTFTSNVPIPAPEPTSAVMLISGLGILGLRKLRRRKQTVNLA